MVSAIQESEPTFHDELKERIGAESHDSLQGNRSNNITYPPIPISWQKKDKTK